MKTSPAFVQYCHDMIDLQVAIEDGDEERADALRDEMSDNPEYHFGGAEFDATCLLSGDLDDVWEVLKGEQTIKHHLYTPRQDSHYIRHAKGKN